MLWAAVDAAWPIPVDYLVQNAEREGLTYLSVFSNPVAALALPHVVWKYMAGPVLCVFALAAIAVGVARKEIRRMIVPTLWFFVPAIVLTLINKRNDYYFVAAIPAIYVAVALGVA